MTERAKIVNEIDPKIKEIDTLLENASITSSDDTLKGELEKNRESLLEEKQKVLDTINSIEKDVEERKKIGISASYQANEMLSQDKSLLNPDYWLYSVPGTMGSSFSDASSYAYGFIGWGIKAAASALAAPFTGGSSLLPLVINTAGTLAAIGSSVIGTDKSNRSEALAETYGAYKDRVNKELQDKGTSLQDLAATVRSKMPMAEANKYTDEKVKDLSVSLSTTVATDYVKKTDVKNTITENNKVVTEADIADIAGAMHFKGLVEKQGTESDIEAINRVITDPKNGDVVLVGTAEYVYDGAQWKSFGDEGLYETKADATAKLVEAERYADEPAKGPVGEGRSALNFKKAGEEALRLFMSKP